MFSKSQNSAMLVVSGVPAMGSPIWISVSRHDTTSTARYTPAVVVCLLLLMALPALSLLETRVLGVLVEKQHTVPDTYPLTLNALAAGCNQKTSRDPVLNATESDVQAA